MNNPLTFSPQLSRYCNHVLNLQPRSARSDALYRKARGPLTWLQPAKLSDVLFKFFQMLSRTPNLVQELARTSPEIQAHVAALQADSDQLTLLTSYNDPGEAVTVMTALGEALIRYAGNEDVTGHDNGPYYIDQLAGLFVRVGEGIAYRQRVDAGQTTVL